MMLLAPPLRNPGRFPKRTRKIVPENRFIPDGIRLPRLCAVLLIALPLAMAGCASKRSTLMIHSVDHDRSFTKVFSEACISINKLGESDIVLVDDDIDTARAGNPTRPIRQAPAPPLRHVLRIRVLWNPPAGTKPDHPSATNASLHWYVFGNSTDESREVIEYQGAGFVTVTPWGDQARVRIRKARLTPLTIRGGMIDPVGSFTATASFSAQLDDRKVAALIAEIDAALNPPPSASPVPADPAPADQME